MLEREQRNTAALESMAQLDLLIKRPANWNGSRPGNGQYADRNTVKVNLISPLSWALILKRHWISPVIREQLSSGQMLDTSDLNTCGADALTQTAGQ